MVESKELRMSVTTEREIYRLGREEHGNREVVILETGTTHDLPAGAKFTYASDATRFPYVIVE